MAEHLLDQVLTIAGNGKTVCKSFGTPHAFHNLDTNLLHEQKVAPYPPEEIAWLATTAFNCAVDFYCSSQDETCRRWAGKALGISSLSDDGGALQDLLQEKYSGLTWDH